MSGLGFRPSLKAIAMMPKAGPLQQAEKPQTLEFQGNKSVPAPAVSGGTESGLPEGNQWRYSEFINAVQVRHHQGERCC